MTLSACSSQIGARLPLQTILWNGGFPECWLPTLARSRDICSTFSKPRVLGPTWESGDYGSGKQDAGFLLSSLAQSDAHMMGRAHALVGQG